MSHQPADDQETTMLVRVPLQVLSLSVAYSVSLGWLERKFPTIKPDHTWAEVAGGVLISLIPVAMEARRARRRAQQEALHWQMYESAVWRAFFASGTPIILWQIGEAVFRHIELIKYTAYGEGRSIHSDAHGTSTLADGGRERTRADSSGSQRGDQLSSGGTGEN